MEPFTAVADAPIIRRRKRSPKQLFRSACHRLRLCAPAAGLAAGVFLLSFVKWFEIPSPFAAAFLLAVSARKPSPALLAGLSVSLGLRLLWGIDADVWQYAGCAGMWLILQKCRPRTSIETAALGGLCMIPRLLAAAIAGDPQQQLLSFAALPLCMLASALLRLGADAAQMGLKQGWERMCLLFGAGLIISGLGYFRVGTVPLGAVAAIGACMLFARANGSVYGVFGGMLCGFLLMLDGHGHGYLLLLSLCGLVGGLPLVGRKRWLSLMIVPALNALAWCVLGTIQPPVGWPTALCGAVAYLLPPASWLDRLDPWLKGAAESSRSMENAFVTQRIAQMQEAIRNLAQALPNWEEEPDAALLRDSLCRQCERRERCWERERSQTEKRLGRAMALSLRGEEAPIPDCPYADRLPDAAFKLQAQQRRRSAASRRYRYERELTLTHLAALSDTLGSLGAMSSGESFHDLQAAHAIHLALEELDVPARLSYARRVDGHLQAALEAEGGLNLSRAVEQLLQYLAKEESLSLAVTRSEKGRIELEEIPLYTAQVGITLMSKGGAKESLCGDACCARRCEGGRMLLMLCDGMGHGEAAHRQSEKTQELLLLLLQAGYTRRQAITAVNGMMLGAQEAERYSTVDLADVDLWTGEVSGEKLGACASWIIRGRHMKKVEGSSLPLGIVQEASPTAAQFRMHSGDILVMMSDGVADALGEDEALKKALADSLFIQPQRMADAILRSALLSGGGTPADDMSVMVMLLMDRRNV